MLRHLIIAAALTLAACSPAQGSDATAAQDIMPIEGTWQNERGSQVKFIVKGHDLSGTYHTNVGQPDKSQSFPLRGFAEGDQVTFTVNFKGYGSMTAWAGQMSADERGVYIQTLWHLTRDVDDADEADDLWGSITAGASTFRPAKSNAD